MAQGRCFGTAGLRLLPTAMEDVTSLFDDYRECVRHLWNTRFRPLAEPTKDWDVRDEFDAIARRIFASLVLRPLNIFTLELSRASEAEPTALPGFIVVPAHESGTPIHINRELPRGGYWDYPLERVLPEDLHLHFLRFFDFDQLGYRDFRYYEVKIHASVAYRETVGRVALIEGNNAKVFYSGSSSPAKYPA